MTDSSTHPLADMLRRDRDEWRALVASLDARPTGALHDPESPAWEAKDIFNHLARWLAHSTDELEARVAGRIIPEPEGSDDEINARWQSEDASLTLAQSRDRAHAAFDRRIAAIEGVSLDRWDDPLIAVAHADCHEHYAEHRRYAEDH